MKYLKMIILVLVAIGMLQILGLDFFLGFIVGAFIMAAGVIASDK